MQEIIKSKDVREYIDKIGYQFTDSGRATLIYNTDWSIQKKHNALLKLSNATTDTELKKQIAERVNYDNHCIEQIKSNSGNCVVHLKIWVKEDKAYTDAGLFSSWQLAEQYAQSCTREFQISKMVIYDTEQQWDEEDWGNSVVAQISYNKEGQEKYYWGADINERLSEYDFERFEYAYVTVPHPFEEGDIVRIIGTDDIGIVRFDKKDKWKEWDEMLKSGEGWLSNWDPDYSDISFPIEILNENAEFGHFHVSPMDVEYAELEDDEKKNLLEMASYLVKGRCYIQEFQAYCEHYAEKQKSPQR